MTLPTDHVLTAIAHPRGAWDVLAFIGSLNVGGCERHLATVYPKLAAAGLRVGIVTFRRGGPLEEELRGTGVDILCLDRGPLHTTIFGVDVSRLDGYVALVTVLTDIVRLLGSRRVAVAHFFLPGAYIFGGLGALISRHSNVVMSRRSLNDYQAAHPISSRIERYLHSKMRLLIANSKQVQAQLIAEGADPDRTLLLYSGVDLASLARAPRREAARDQFGIASNLLVIAIVANLIPYKGHVDLIQALGRIAVQIKGEWVLFVAGRDDGIRQSLEKQAETLGIAGNVRMLGSIGNVPAFWRAADIGVLASHEEGLPNSLMEGMALGIPMVATSVGGVKDIATDGVDALLVPPRDPNALGAALLRLIEDPALRARVGGAAATRIANVFPLAACVNAYRRLYNLMLRQPDVAGADIARQFRAHSLGGTPKSELL